MKRVLVVEDDADIRLTLVQLLELEGYSTESAANGQEALDVLKSRPQPDLIILDIMMPVKDGFEFRDEQRSTLPETRSIPVLVMTADATAEEKLPKLDAAGYFKKPVDMNLFLGAIAQLTQ